MGVRNLPPPCCVLEQDTLLPENTDNTQEADMTEKMLTETLSPNTNKQTNKQTNKIITDLHN